MAQYKKKPVVVEAIQWTGDNLADVLKFTGSEKCEEKVEGVELAIHTPEGNHCAQLNDYIIKGIQGGFYPCKPDIFEETYEEVIK